MTTEIVFACPQVDCNHWRCAECPVESYKIIGHGNPRPSTPRNPNIPLQSASPQSTDQPVVVDLDEDQSSLPVQKSSGSDISPKTLLINEDDRTDGGSNLAETQGKDGKLPPSMDDGKEKQKIWREAELPLHERIRQQDDKVRGPLVVPIVSKRKGWAGFDIEEYQGVDEDNGLLAKVDKHEGRISSVPFHAPGEPLSLPSHTWGKQDVSQVYELAIHHQVNKVLTKDTSGRPGILSSTPAKQDLEDEQILASVSEDDGSEIGVSGPVERKGYREPQGKPRALSEEGISSGDENLTSEIPWEEWSEDDVDSHWSVEAVEGIPTYAYEMKPRRTRRKLPPKRQGYKNLTSMKNDLDARTVDWITHLDGIYPRGNDARARQRALSREDPVGTLHDFFSPEEKGKMVEAGIASASGDEERAESSRLSRPESWMHFQQARDQKIAALKDEEKNFTLEAMLRARAELENVDNPLEEERNKHPNILSRGKADIYPTQPPKLVFTKGRYLSRSSSAESLQSLADSIFSIVSLSSASTPPRTDNAFQRVLVILKSDSVLKALYEELTTKTSAGKFNRNFGTLLKRFALKLEEEAKCWNEQRAAQFIRSRARMMAQKIAGSLYPAERKAQPGNAGQAKGEISEDRDLGEEPEPHKGEITEDSDLEEEPDDFAELEKFITNSTAFQRLRDNICEFLGLEPSAKDATFAVGTCTLLKELPFGREDQVDISNIPTFYEQSPCADVLNGWDLTSFIQQIRELLLPEQATPAGLLRVRWRCVSPKLKTSSNDIY
jgi:hypothetical protein